MKLNEVHELTIIELVERSGLSMDSLKDDLIDHLCCEVEEKLTRGVDFQSALSQSVSELAPKGFPEIEEQTLFLLNSYKIIFMKKVIYLVGLLSAMALSAGYVTSLLKLFEVGRPLAIIGALGFAFLFLPMFMISVSKTIATSDRLTKVRYYAGVISAELLALSLAMKLGHFKGADILLVLSGGMFTLAFLPVLFFTMYKKAIQTA